MGQVYEPEVETHPDPPERDDNAERIRLSPEARRRLLEFGFRAALLHTSIRPRRSSWWRDVGEVIFVLLIKPWPVWLLLYAIYRAGT